MNLSKEAEAALRAMERAAVAARSLASEKNLKLPVWRDGKIVFIGPKAEANQVVDRNAENAQG